MLHTLRTEWGQFIDWNTDSKLDNGVERNEMSLVKGEEQAVGGTEKRPGSTR